MLIFVLLFFLFLFKANILPSVQHLLDNSSIQVSSFNAELLFLLYNFFLHAVLHIFHMQETGYILRITITLGVTVPSFQIIYFCSLSGGASISQFSPSLMHFFFLLFFSQFEGSN
jgi:hypothetical protein